MFRVTTLSSKEIHGARVATRNCRVHKDNVESIFLQEARVGRKRVSISRQSQSVCCSNPIENMTFKQGRHSDVYHHLQAHQYFTQDDYRCMSGEVISYRI